MGMKKTQMESSKGSKVETQAQAKGKGKKVRTKSEGHSSTRKKLAYMFGNAFDDAPYYDAKTRLHNLEYEMS
jgi:hypothetical protein